MIDVVGFSREVVGAWTSVAADSLGLPQLTWSSAGPLVGQAPALAQTPRDEIALPGGARLYHFRGPGKATGKPFLLVPSMINRWYVLDLRPGASLVEALVAAFPATPFDDGVPARISRGWSTVAHVLAGP